MQGLEGLLGSSGDDQSGQKQLPSAQRMALQLAAAASDTTELDSMDLEHISRPKIQHSASAKQGLPPFGRTTNWFSRQASSALP